MDSENSASEKNGDSLMHDGPADNGAEEAEAGIPPAAPADEQLSKAMNSVLYSDIGISTLLNRLKQSIASARDFAGFLKKRSSLEEDHAQGLKKLAKATHDSIRRQDTRHGTYAQQLEAILAVHERMADNGMQYALSLHQMHEDLSELANNMERGRKHWKGIGTSAEKKVQDAETHMEKAKAKYDSLAEDYDRVRTGDKSTGRSFGLKGMKSGAQHEEDLKRKLDAADVDYASRVQAAQSQRQELENQTRPETVRKLQELISECDSALTLQLQKYAAFNEKLLLGNGILVSPISESNDQGPPQRSLREMAMQIDNEKDLQSYIMGFTSKVPARTPTLKYEQHPTLRPIHQTPPAPVRQPQQQAAPSQPPPTFSTQPPQHQHHLAAAAAPTYHPYNSNPLQQHPPTERASLPGSGAPGGPPGGPYSAAPQQQHQTYLPSAGAAGGPSSYASGPSSYASGPMMSQPRGPQAGGMGGPPPVPYKGPGGPGGAGPGQGPMLQQHQQQLSRDMYPATAASGMPSAGGMVGVGAGAGDPPPLRPVFGVSLQDLFVRDQSPVPMVVYQCVLAVDVFGLDVEGIYRVPGTATHVARLKALFDNDSSKVDFRNPENFFHDVNSVAGLLKQFFRDLPDPLFTSEHYAGFIDAARIDDDIVRRDSLHAIINALPDPNYATLRALVLHLNRVQEHSQTNRMSTSNLAICFAPTLMGPHRGPMSDAGLQARVVDTILQNTYQIFDED